MYIYTSPSRTGQKQYHMYDIMPDISFLTVHCVLSEIKRGVCPWAGLILIQNFSSLLGIVLFFISNCVSFFKVESKSHLFYQTVYLVSLGRKKTSIQSILIIHCSCVKILPPVSSLFFLPYEHKLFWQNELMITGVCLTYHILIFFLSLGSCVKESMLVPWEPKTK